MEEYFNRVESIKNLISEKYLKGIRRNNIFVYGHIRDERLFDSYNQYFLKTDEFKIAIKKMGFLAGEANFYFSDYPENDAFGGIQTENDLPVVVVSNCLLEALHNYCENLSLGLSDVLKEWQFNVDVEGVFKIRLERFLFSIATTFLYFHEISHVIQDEKKGPTDNSQTDNTTGSDTSIFDLESHVRELDADQFATRMVCRQVLNYFQKELPQEKQNPSNLADLTSFALLGISVLFHVLSNQLKVKFYLRSGTHPHHAIRIKTSIEIINDIFEIVQIEVDASRMIDIYVKITTYVFGSTRKFLEHINDPEPIEFLDEIGNTYYGTIKSEDRQIEIQEYLDDMFEKTKMYDYTLTMRNIG